MWRIQHILPEIQIHAASLESYASVFKAFQQVRPDDYVVSSGETHSVKEFCKKAFSLVDLDYRDFVVQDDRLFCPAEVDMLLGDCTKARKRLAWNYTRTLDELITEMVQNDFERESGK
jgi:GDPmannose 4,6-dehydratase